MAYIPQHYERAEEFALSRMELIAEKMEQLHASLQELFKLGLAGDVVRMPYASTDKNGKPVEALEDFRSTMEWCLTRKEVMQPLLLACQCEFPANRLRYLAEFESAAAKCYADTYAADLAEIAADAAIAVMQNESSEW